MTGIGSGYGIETAAGLRGRAGLLRGPGSGLCHDRVVEIAENRHSWQNARAVQSTGTAWVA